MFVWLTETALDLSDHGEEFGETDEARSKAATTTTLLHTLPIY